MLEMTVETAFELVFAAGVVAAAAALASAAFARVGSRTLVAVSVALAVAAVAAWVAFALDPGRELAIAAGGLVACVVASIGAVGLRRGIVRSRAVDADAERLRTELAASVDRELRTRAAELELTLSRARADSLSSYVDEERKLGDERRRLAVESEEGARAELAGMLASVQRQVEQRPAIARLREELTKAAQAAATAADAELESHAADRRRALHDVDERLRARERDLGTRIEREQADAARRIQATFADIERRQVEQLERSLERARDRFSDAAAQQFDRAVRTAREEAAQRLSRELDRSVQMFAREGESLLAERLAQLGDTGALRLEKKLNQVAAALERQREEFVATTERRLSELEADFRDRLAALAEDEETERGALEARLQELSRRIDQALARAEERLTSLRGLS